MNARYPRPAILEALAADRHHVIEASAGTGKTFTIEHLVVDKLLREGVDITKLLVVTFTERAAAELRSRIRDLVARLLALAQKPTGKVVPEPAWELDDEAVRRLSQAMLRIDQASISTIHAFCQRLLTENAFAHQRLFAQRLMDGREIFSLAFRDYLRDSVAIDGALQPLLRTVLEGAGGFQENEGVEKLQTTLYEALRRYGRIEPPFNQDAIEAALAALPKVLPTPEAIFSAYKAGKGRRHEKTVHQLWDAVTDCVARAREAEGVSRWWTLSELRDGKTRADLDSLLKHTDERAIVQARALAEVIPPRNALLIHLMLPELRQRVRKLKESQGLYDFDDMLAVVEESLRGPNGEAIIATLRTRYQYALIDEFQDTDPIQWEVFRRVFVEGDSPSRLLVIGDPKQAIYGFRAADVETYLSARALLCGTSDPAKLERRIVRLKQNFRSSKRMIDAYNLVLCQEPASGKPLFDHDPRIQYTAQAQVSCGDPSIKLLEGENEAAPIHLLNFRPPGRSVAKDVLGKPTAAFIADEIRHLLDVPHFITDGRAGVRRLLAKDIFVLSRARSEGEEVARFLAERGIPHAFYKRNGLFQTDEVQDLIDVLEAISSPDDPRARATAWLTPFFGLTLEEAERAHEVGDDSPLVSRLRRWSELALRRDFRTLFSSLIDDSGFARRVAFLMRGEAPLANTLRVLDLLTDEAGRRHATLRELTELLRSYRLETATPQQDVDLQPVETDQPAVQLMTMHASKGLEAPVVFLIGGTGAPPGSEPYVYRDQENRRCLWFGKLPEELKEPVRLEEARESERLLYVALTRAKVRLYLPLYLDAEDSSLAAKLDGPYRALNERLLNLQAAAPPPELFVTRVVSPLPPASEVEALNLRGWSPPGELSVPEDAVAERARISRVRRGSIVTSYTALSRHQKPAEIDREDVTGETYASTPAVADPLTSSAVVGIFLHDALEVLPLEYVRALPSREAFRKDAQVRGLVEPIADREGIPAAQRDRAYDILFASLRTPIAVGTLKPVPGIAALDRVLRESEFAYPIPERTHALLGARASGAELPFAVERGMVKGFIDVVFEHEGKLFFADWKSDVLPSATPEAMRKHVEHRYDWQMKVYALAVVRMLRIETAAEYAQRFGGFLYLFLRELTNTPAGEVARGSYFHRPDWDEVRRWERALVDHPYGLEQEVA